MTEEENNLSTLLQNGYKTALENNMFLTDEEIKKIPEKKLEKILQKAWAKAMKLDPQEFDFFDELEIIFRDLVRKEIKKNSI